jgi:diguanylate cyclase (GGDEF)-like protein
MELKTYLNILLKKWWIVLPTFLVTVTAGVVFTYTQMPLYSATATYVVVPSTVFGAVKDFANGLDMLGRRDEIATTFAEIAASQKIKSQAVAAISLPSGRNYLASSKLRAGTNILEFTVQGPDPTVVRDLANAIGVATEEYVKGSYEIFSLRMLDEATIPLSPTGPGRSLYLTLTAIFGLILGIGLAFFSEYLAAPLEPIADFNIIDKQTGVYNKSYFLQRLNEEMVRAKRNRYPLSVALMRVDNLGQLNGINSGKARYELLHQVGTLARQYLREEDLLAYLGDDVFATLLPDITGENAKAIMEYLQTRVGLVSLRSTANGPKINLRGIVGVTTYNHNGTSRDDLVALADRALQMAEVNEDGRTYLINDSSAMDSKHV